MNPIMENWNKFLITEAARGPNDLEKLFSDNKINYLNAFRNFFQITGVLDDFVRNFKHQLSPELHEIGKLYDTIRFFKLDRLGELRTSEKRHDPESAYMRIQDDQAGDEYFSKTGWFARRKWEKIKNSLNEMGFSKPDYKLDDIFIFLKQKLLKGMAGMEPPRAIIIIEPGSKAMVSYGLFIKGNEKGKSRIMSINSGARGTDIINVGVYPGGAINFKKSKTGCLGAFIVQLTFDTTKGWGPMLYDVAMEYASIKGSGLTPDRTSVSRNAQKVWDYYLNRRNDVDPKQLDADDESVQDFDLKKLTPEIEEDDCYQEMSVSVSMSSKVPWHKTPLSKVYRKDPKVIQRLGKMGLLHAPDLDYNLLKDQQGPDKGWWASLKKVFFEE